MGIELRRVFLYAVQVAQGAFAVFVEVFVLRFSLAEAHPPNVGYELLHVVCGGDVDAVELAQGAGIVHLGHAHEGKVVQSFGLASRIVLGQGHGSLSIKARGVEVSVVVMVRQRVELVGFMHRTGSTS